MKEKRDLYNNEGKPTGLTYYKGEKVPEGYYPMVVMICLQNKKGEFLMQKRVLEKGGDWGVTGGHPKAGETPEQGIITEVKEELGLDISGLSPELFSQGCDGKDCFRMYYLCIDIDIEKLTIQKEELTEVKWFSMQELQDMVDKKILNLDQIACFTKCVDYLHNKK